LRLWAAFKEEQDQQYTRGSGQHSEKNKINNILEALGSIQRRTRSTIYLRLWTAFREEQDQQYT
jgi:hypothetical protein